MLEACGLRGHRIGGAQISPKHANFIENVGGARTAMRSHLIAEARRRRAREQFGVVLEPEVQLLGDIEIPPIERGARRARVGAREPAAKWRRAGGAGTANRRRRGAGESGLRSSRARLPFPLAHGPLVAAFVVVAGLALSGGARDLGLRSADGRRGGCAGAGRRTDSGRPLAAHGASLASLDQEDVVRRRRVLADGRAAEADRDFPHSLRLVVRPERAVAVLRRASDAWLVSARGRVIRPLEPGPLGNCRGSGWRPARRSAGRVPSRCPTQGGAPVEALARLPMGFPGRCAAARGTARRSRRSCSARRPSCGSARRRSEAEIGRRSHRPARPGHERAPVADYLDVSLPTRARGASKVSSRSLSLETFSTFLLQIGFDRRWTACVP